MLTALLVIIFVSFIGVGLPDSVLGTAWPAMVQEFSLPISLAGYITAAVSASTMVSSLLSARLIQRFGTGWVTAVSTLLTAIALLGFAVAPHPVFFFLLAIPLGLGAGAIDTALNSFVALHYSAAQMNFMQCFYGVGVAASPFIMALALGDAGDWRKGYLIVAAIQWALTALTFLSLPMWGRVQRRFAAEDAAPPRTIPMRALLKMPALRLSCFAFFTSCALELTVGSWSASFFVNARGAAKDDAALMAMLFYIGLALGRFFSGLVVKKMGRRGVLRLSLLILPVAIVAYLLPVHIGVSAAALLFIGLGVGPIYPNLVHLTPRFVEEEAVQSAMGLQQAVCYAGILVMPWLFGVLAEAFSTALLPVYLLVLCVLYAASFIRLMRRC